MEGFPLIVTVSAEQLTASTCSCLADMAVMIRTVSFTEADLAGVVRSKACWHAEARGTCPTPVHGHRVGCKTTIHSPLQVAPYIFGTLMISHFCHYCIKFSSELKPATAKHHLSGQTSFATEMKGDIQVGQLNKPFNPSDSIVLHAAVASSMLIQL
jgi:hypothetical protein